MSDPRIPVICVDPSSVPSLTIFNPNNWIGESKAIVQSCATVYSVLQHGVKRIADVCLSSNRLCQPHIDNLVAQWKQKPWDLSKAICYGQVPELHMLIEAFFSGIKSFLDLAVQLISTEGIVGSRLQGFHQVGSTYGGNVLNSLERNVRKGREQDAQRIRAFISEQKELWIDEVIESRHQLIHPSGGIHQLMFRFELEDREGDLVCREVVPPFVGESQIDVYSARRMQNLRDFALRFIDILKPTKPAA